MATHSSTLAWKIPWMEEPARLQSMGLRRVGHDWATSLSLFTFMHWRRKWQPTPMFLPGESQDRSPGAAVYGVPQSRTQLMWLSSSSRRYTKLSWSSDHIYIHIYICIFSSKEMFNRRKLFIEYLPPNIVKYIILQHITFRLKCQKQIPIFTILLKNVI